MKPYLLLLTLPLCAAALADDKPLATQQGEAMAPNRAFPICFAARSRYSASTH
nr:hypothetical protein [Pseudomonas benzenivorans]